MIFDKSRDSLPHDQKIYTVIAPWQEKFSLIDYITNLNENGLA